jgi:hypothetical protein
MLSALTLAFALQSAPPQQSKSDSIQRRIEKQIADQIAQQAIERAERRARQREEAEERSADWKNKRVVTLKDLATAFRDSEAKDILLLARNAPRDLHYLLPSSSSGVNIQPQWNPYRGLMY